MPDFYHDGLTIPAAPTKDPDSVIDYGATYSNWLATDEVITASNWLVNGTLIETNGDEVDGLTVDSRENNSSSTKCWLSGGTRGTFYTLTNRITTSEGRTEDRSMTFYCNNK